MLTKATRGPPPFADERFAREILPLVSRTFAPSIEILPEELADPVRLSYLLCRVADTFEDATHLSPKARHAFLMRFIQLLIHTEVDQENIDSFAEEAAGTFRTESTESNLILGLPRLMRLLGATIPDQRRIIINWIRELSLGMARFVLLEEEDATWTALATTDDLIAYEYSVAGTVGCLLNDLFHLHIYGPSSLSLYRVRQLAISFGLGLQGSNIIQDMSEDRKRRWSYIPEEVARRHGLSSLRLIEPSERSAAMEVVREMTLRALADLDDGFEYVLRLPRRQPRIRLFCLWPLLLAIRTLTLIVSGPMVLVRRVRISRDEVRMLTRESTWRCLSNAALRRLYRRERVRFVKTVGEKDGRAIKIHN